MISQAETYDNNLRAYLEACTALNEDYWSFRGKSSREHAHAFFQYPAMMVPQMQRELICIIRSVDPEIKTVFDPFMGSGTVMTESMLEGLDFVGQDINPLAFLLCRVKKGPFFPVLKKKAQLLVERIEDSTSSSIVVDFPGLAKWFQKSVVHELSQIKRAIEDEPLAWARRFFWVILAETVRLTSNSRTSTFKLHIRPKEEISTREVSPKKIFEDILKRNIDRFAELRKRLCNAGLLRRGHYKGNVTLKLADAKEMNNKCSPDQGAKFDLLVTSPPYGDNATTVPYGQHSYLPLQWIRLEDISNSTDRSYLDTTHEIDSRSLGGTRRGAVTRSRVLESLSPTFQRIMHCLEDEPPDRRSRLAAFCLDLNDCLSTVMEVLRDDAYMVWTIGNRTIANNRIPVDDILSELLANKGAREVIRLQRSIPTKRMAKKNNISFTMACETILIMRKGA